MYAYIRDISGYSHIALWKIISYEIPIFSEDDESGTITVMGEKDDCSGNWCILDDGRIYYISESSSTDGLTDITLKLPFHAFDRKLVYSGSGTEDYGTYISTILTTEFIEQTDPLYATPYLSVTSNDGTEFKFPVESGEEFMLADIFKAAEKDGVRFLFSAEKDGISLTINTFSQSTHNVFIGNGHNILTEQSFSSSIVAKVTVAKEGTSTTKTYYWYTDGTVSETPPDPRVKGVWDRTKVDSGTSFEDGAREIMKENTSSYKIEFYTDRTDLAYGDRAFVRVKEQTHEVVVSSAFYSSDYKNLLVKCGTLPTTLREKLQKKRK